MKEGSPRRERRPYRRPTVTSERIEEIVLASKCKKRPTDPGFDCQSVKRFYG